MNDPAQPPSPRRAPDEQSEVPHVAAEQAHVHKHRHFSWIWLIPLVAALIGGWLAWTTLSSRGRLITVTFQSAEGLVAGQSKVKRKQVDLGTVEHIELTKDLSRVNVTIRMTREADPLLTDKAQFWVVKPRLFAGSLSGLDTLLSGSYIAMLPGAEGGQATDHFTGLEDPPVLESDVPGRTFLLKANRIGNISLGSPIFYRDFSVGEVLGWDVGDMADNVLIHAFVREPFDKYVRDGSRFWNASGVSVKLGASGIDLELQSLRAVVLGGIAFETPDEARSSKPSADRHQFPLYANQDAAESAAYSKRIPFVSYFDESVSGLARNSSVTVRGIKVGQVTDIQLQHDPSTDHVQAAVRFEVEPQRITETGGDPNEDPKVVVARLVAHGMRAQLTTTNILTGSQAVALDILPKAPPAEMKVEGDYLMVPTAPGGGLGDVATSASALMEKLRDLPFQQIADNLNDTLKGISAVANGPELRDTLTAAQATMKELQETVRNVDAGLDPALKRLPAIATGLQNTVAHADRLVTSAQSGYGDDSRFHRDIDRLLSQLNDTARSVRVLADLLTRHPEALIRGRTDTGPN
jgi:paraquat-inducible protein B